MTRSEAAKICQSIKFMMDKDDYSEEVEEALNMAIAALKQLSLPKIIIRQGEQEPSAQPERKKGKWIVLDECSNEGVYCSECHKKVLKIDYSNTMKCKNFKFCPNCGADMRGDEE